MAWRDHRWPRYRARLAAYQGTGAWAKVQKIDQVAKLDHLDIPAFPNTAAEIERVFGYNGLATLSEPDKSIRVPE